MPARCRPLHAFASAASRLRVEPACTGRGAALRTATMNCQPGKLPRKPSRRTNRPHSMAAATSPPHGPHHRRPSGSSSRHKLAGRHDSPTHFRPRGLASGPGRFQLAQLRQVVTPSGACAVRWHNTMSTTDLRLLQESEATRDLPSSRGSRLAGQRTSVLCSDQPIECVRSMRLQPLQLPIDRRRKIVR